MDPAALISLLMALGAGSALTQVITWLTRKKEAGANITSTLTGAAAELVTAIQADNDNLRKEVTAAKTEATALRSEVKALSERLDRLIPIVAAEKTWAAQALKDLEAATGRGYEPAPVLMLSFGS